MDVPISPKWTEAISQGAYYSLLMKKKRGLL